MFARLRFSAKYELESKRAMAIAGYLIVSSAIMENALRAKKKGERRQTQQRR
jgi:hypothetical protein